MLRFSKLGQFALHLGDLPVELSARSAQLLLIYLLLHPDTHHRREKIAGLLWPEISEVSVRSNLCGALLRARKALQFSRPRIGNIYRSVTERSSSACHSKISWTSPEVELLTEFLEERFWTSSIHKYENPPYFQGGPILLDQP